MFKNHNAYNGSAYTENNNTISTHPNKVFADTMQDWNIPKIGSPVNSPLP